MLQRLQLREGKQWNQKQMRSRQAWWENQLPRISSGMVSGQITAGKDLYGIVTYTPVRMVDVDINMGAVKVSIRPEQYRDSQMVWKSLNCGYYLSDSRREYLRRTYRGADLYMVETPPTKRQHYSRWVMLMKNSDGTFTEVVSSEG